MNAESAERKKQRALKAEAEKFKAEATGATKKVNA